MLAKDYADAGDIEDAYSTVMHASVRHGFIRKVYGILSVQLAVTFGFIFYMQSSTAVMDWLLSSLLIFYSVLFLPLIIIVAMACCPNLARQTPTNYIMLAVFTVCESILVGLISSLYDPLTVLMAIGITGAIVFSLTLFAFQTKVDFTGAGPYLFVLLMCLMLMGIVSSYLPGIRTLYAGCGAVLFSFYIVYDTQLLIGGKHKKHAIGVDDYVFAAITLYLDIINLFIYILSIIGGRK